MLTSSSSPRFLAWLLAAGCAAALGTVAAVAWRAADQQRRDGEAAMRQSAADTAEQVLTAAGIDLRAPPGISGEREWILRYGQRWRDETGLPKSTGIPLNESWFTTPGEAGDWVFGPWPRPESSLSKAFAEIQALQRAGDNGAAVRAFKAHSEFGSYVYATAVWSSNFAPIRTYDAARDVNLAETASGLPLAPLIVRFRMAHVTTGPDRRAAALNLLSCATAHPSPLTHSLIEEAAAALTEPSDDEARAVAAARNRARQLEQLRDIVRLRARSIASGTRWIDDWHFAPAQDRQYIARTRSELAALARERKLGSGTDTKLPGGWHYRLWLDNRLLTDASVTDESAVMAVAETGPWRLEAVSRRADESFATLDAQLARQRWLIAGATAFMGAAAVAFLLVLARQRRLNAMMANFVAAVSHELRAPIGSMGLLAERLSDGRAGHNGDQAQYHRLIRDECRRLSATIGNVLTFSRRQRGLAAFEPELSDLTALLHDAITLMRPQADERSLILSTDFPDKPVERELDPVIIRQAVLNLLDNAIKFSPPCGTVRLRLRESADGFIAITVRDEGPGVPAAERTRIFKPFYRTGSELRRETPGIGIGLAIVHAAAEAHNGTATAAAAPGRGAEFTLRLGPST